jgi:hypothetical protein
MSLYGLRRQPHALLHRALHSHGATWERVPLKLRDHPRDAGMAWRLVGKTCMQAEDEGMAAHRPRKGARGGDVTMRL